MTQYNGISWRGLSGSFSVYTFCHWNFMVCKSYSMLKLLAVGLTFCDNSSPQTSKILLIMSLCVSVPVLVGRTRGVKACPHSWVGQVEVLQIEREGLPGSPACLCSTPPLTLNLHGDWTLTGRQNPQSVPLAQVCETPPTHLVQGDKVKEGMWC